MTTTSTAMHADTKATPMPDTQVFQLEISFDATVTPAPKKEDQP